MYSPLSLPPIVPETEGQQSPTSDALMTADRREQKYLLPHSHSAELARTIGSHLSRHFPPGALRLPGAQQFATTIYFDTASRHLFNQASVADASVKMRAREYYTVDPSMVEIARSPQQLVRFDPVLWFELKHKRGSQVRKQRFGVPKHDVPGFLSNGSITQEMVDLQSDRFGEKASEALAELARLCQLYGEPFDVDCVINYRRLAWQNEQGTLRLTLDRQVSFYAPPTDIWTRDFALIRETLGHPKGTLDRSILEVKSRGSLPDWLAAAIDAADGERLDFSKFVAGSDSVHR